MEFKFAIFNNLNNTVVLQVEKKTVQTVAMTNNRNSLKKFLSSSDIHRNLRSKLLAKLENALTVSKMNDFEIGFAVINGNPAIAAYSSYENAVVIACDVRGAKKTWKALGTNLNVHKPREDSKGNYVAMQTGHFVEIVEKIEFLTEQKVDDVRSEMEIMKEKFEELEKKYAAVVNENSVLKKHIKGEELSFDEEIIIVSLNVSEPTKVEETDKDIEELMNGVSSTDSDEKVSKTSSDSLVFSLTNPAENINKDPIVIIDQSTEKQYYQPIAVTDSMISARERRLARINQERSDI
ncbi:hypothetical protein [Serratia marcescens]|uniref:hypothetical protein n=1 Tax=Serratia marcescens TaxID=615 RepID=UPI001F14BFE4|nr:hypothetical protein [Serratia marcescens]MDP8728348.1 hypothetical protein [Serratia marcescens]